MSKDSLYSWILGIYVQSAVVRIQQYVSLISMVSYRVCLTYGQCVDDRASAFSVREGESYRNLTSSSIVFLKNMHYGDHCAFSNKSRDRTLRGFLIHPSSIGITNFRHDYYRYASCVQITLRLKIYEWFLVAFCRNVASSSCRTSSWKHYGEDGRRFYWHRTFFHEALLALSCSSPCIRKCARCEVRAAFTAEHHLHGNVTPHPVTPRYNLHDR